jgi:prepilin-type N-terminal cleavage/methylation domain-containing protein/prepilin-type processing-associated H-X9-DG protein
MPYRNDDVALRGPGDIMKTRSRSHPRGFTLVELLVVLAVIGVLLAIVLPAVQRARNTVLRVQCASNLHQIGLAAHQYHAMRDSFPPGAHIREGNLLSSWLTDLLPFIEQENLWMTTQAAYGQSPLPFVNPPHVGLATPIPVYACPADNRAGQVGFAPRQQMNVAFTSYLGVEGQDTNSRDGVFYPDSYTRIEDIVDGTSNTLFAGERPPSADEQYGWWYAGIGQGYTGSLDATLGVQEVNLLPLAFAYCLPGPYQYGPGVIGNECDMFHFWSLHQGGGANFLFADGAVHFLTYDAAPLMPALASRAGNEGVMVPE